MEMSQERLSDIQLGILYSQMKYPDSTLYNVGGYASIKGELDVTRLIKSIELQLHENDLLIASIGFLSKKTDAVSHDLDIEFIDFSDEDNSEVKCSNWMNLDITTMFYPNISLLKTRILKASDRKYYWYVKTHHILFDGFSMSLFFNNVSKVYLALSINPDEKPAIHNFKYIDFISEEAIYKSSETYKSDEKFWSERLLRLEKEPILGSCMKLAKRGKIGKSIRKDFALSRLTFSLIEDFCALNKVTIVHYFIGIIYLLNRLYNNDTFVIGLPIFNRTNMKFKNTLGTFVKILPITIPLYDDISFIQLLNKIKKEIIDCYKHKGYPLIDIYSKHNIREDVSNVIFSYQKNVYENNFLNADSSITYLNNTEQLEDLQIHLLEYSEKDDLVISFDYKTDSFPEYIIDGLAQHCNELINSQFKLPESNNVFQQEILSSEEKLKLLQKFNSSKSDILPATTIIKLFEEQVFLHPDTIALVYEDKHISYKELNERSNRLANYLRKNYGLAGEDLIGIQLERNEYLIISLLGVLKGGGAYVPLDPDYPADRIKYIIEDSGCKLILDKEELTKFIAVSEDYDNSNPSPISTGSDLSHIIYTSGSTGKPKGVMIEHKNVSSFIDWCLEEFKDSDFDTVLGVTSICFDLSIYEIIYTLCCGKKLRLLANALAIPSSVNPAERTLLNTVPSVVKMLLDEQFDFKQISVLNMAGEPIPKSVIEKLNLKDIEVRNLYGPSEDTTYSTCYKITENSPVLIGKPISGTQCYILNDLKLVPIGITGEICLSGAGLSRGYLNNPGLTSEKFIAHPFLPGIYMYRTGDLGRWLPDGNIEFIGRKDGQVKIRGYRIELGEIENVIQQHPSVDESVVICRGEEEKKLVAYIVSKALLDIKDLETHLKKYLPEYMLPANYILLDKLPLTPNGKLDKSALPYDGGISLQDVAEYVAPETELEKDLALIWSEILGIEVVKIGRNHDFFNIGGHSLKTINLLNKIYKKFEVKLDLKDLFKNTHLYKQAILIDKVGKTAYDPIPLVNFQESYPLSYSQLRLLLAYRLEKNSSTYNMTGVFTFNGDLNQEVLNLSLKAIIERHEILRTVFRDDDFGETRQYILPIETFNFSIYNLSLNLESNKHEKIEALVKQEIALKFDLTIGPLLKATMVKEADNKHLFIFSMHHMIGDELSINILLKELVHYYNFYSGNEQAELQPLNIQYKDYSCWMQSLIEKNRLNSQKIYWLERLKGEIKPLKFNYDIFPENKTTFTGNSLNFDIKEETNNKIREISKSYDISEFCFYLAAFKSFLFLYTRQEDIVIGIPVSAREHADLQDQIGFYVNLLPIRTQFNENVVFENILRETGKQVIDALCNQMYPIDYLAEELNFKRDSNNSGYITAGFTWTDMQFKNITFNENLILTAYPIKTSIVKQDLWLFGNGREFFIEYKENLFSEDAMGIFIERFTVFLDGLSLNTLNILNKYDITTNAERELMNKKINISINF